MSPPAEEEKRYRHCDDLDVEDMDRTQDLYRECHKLIPPKKFSFAKKLILAANLKYDNNIQKLHGLFWAILLVLPQNTILRKSNEI